MIECTSKLVKKNDFRHKLLHPLVLKLKELKYKIMAIKTIKFFVLHESSLLAGIHGIDRIRSNRVIKNPGHICMAYG